MTLRAGALSANFRAALAEAIVAGSKSGLSSSSSGVGRAVGRAGARGAEEAFVSVKSDSSSSF